MKCSGRFGVAEIFEVVPGSRLSNAVGWVGLASGVGRTYLYMASILAFCGVLEY